jgi:hypothetical protein
MKELTPKQEADYFRRVIERTNAMHDEQEAEMRESQARIKLIKYISINNLAPDDVDFIELINTGKIKSEAEADKYFKNITKSKAPKESVKSKIKGAIKYIQ